ncbi:AAA family ATPase [Streptomyces fuscichromogenes]|uniref:Uncharacterized protein n=1 Tax=Streptomyces fuscichromogenes TaxID=1324013 RepID=A0A917XQT1_9ACTN|nr:AAA family ATPase [Streptomyces fuscichromogenes]GGN46671.1 hypothetical protein GCM10011578_099700 [Streptomyces fuscichromogenes]
MSTSAPLLDEARRTQVIPAVAGEAFERAEARFAAGHRGRNLDQGQRTLAWVLALSDRLVEVGHREPGTGSHTVLGLLAAAVREAGGTVTGIASSATGAAYLSAVLDGTPALALDTWCRSRSAEPRLHPGDMLIVTGARTVLEAWPERVRQLVDKAAHAGAVVRLIGQPA